MLFTCKKSLKITNG